MPKPIVRVLTLGALLPSLLVGACGPTCPPAPCGGICASNQVCVEDVCDYTCETNLDCERIDARLGYCAPDHICNPPPTP